MTIKHSLHFGLQGGPIFDFLKQTNKKKTKAYKIDQNLNTKKHKGYIFNKKQKLQNNYEKVKNEN